MKSHLRFLCYSDWTSMGLYRLAIISETPDGKAQAANPVAFGPQELREGLKVPTALGLEASDCEALMDALWRAGIRPTRHSQEEKAELEAVRDHLKDMRQIAFSATKIVPPEHAGARIAPQGKA